MPLPPHIAQTQGKLPQSVRSLTVLPVPRVGKKQQQDEQNAVKPVATTMSKMFPSVDKVCGAPFVKKVFGLTSKKNAVLFIADCMAVYNYFMDMERKMAMGRDSYRQEIAQFMGQVTIQKEISAFKVQLKQKEAEQKLLKKEMERQAIREQERASIIEEERNRIMAESFQDEANKARAQGDEATARIFEKKAQEALSKQKHMEAAVEAAMSGSSDSSCSALEEEVQLQPLQPPQQQTSLPVPTTTPAAVPEPQPQVQAQQQPKQQHQIPDDATSFGIDTVKKLMDATAKQGLFLARAGDMEFEVGELTIDKNLKKLVINLIPIQKEPAPQSPTISFG